MSVLTALMLALASALLLTACAPGDEASDTHLQSLPLTIEVLTDPHASLTIDDICCVPALNFMPLAGNQLTPGYGPQPYWLRIETHGQGGLLDLDALVDEADLYAVDPVTGDITVMQAGDTRPASVRPILAAHIVFPISPEMARRDLYLRVIQATRITIAIGLYEPDAYWPQAYRTSILRAVLIGGIAIMIVYNFVLSATTRDLTFLFNAMTILSILMLDLYLTGVGSAYIWAETPEISNRIVNISLLGATLFGGPFFYFFLRSGMGNDPRYLKALFVAPVLSLALLLVLPWISYWRVQMVNLGLLALMVVSMLVVCLLEARRGSRRAYTLLAPLLCGILPGATLTASQKIWGADFGAIDEHLLEITLISEAMLFSLALAYRIRIVQDERNRMQQSLVGHMAGSERRLIAAVDEERSRIASDLHDTAGQSLLAIVNRITRLRGKPDIEPQLAGELDMLASVSSETVSDIRRISHDLHSATLEQLGLRRALEGLAERATVTGEFAVHTQNDVPDGLISTEQSQHVYRTIQELITNAVKHSGGGNCYVNLGSDGREVIIEVRDDGHGMNGGRNADSEEEEGLGMELVAQRIRCLNGTWSLDNRAPGTTIRIRFPLDEPAVGMKR